MKCRDTAELDGIQVETVHCCVVFGKMFEFIVRWLFTRVRFMLFGAGRIHRGFLKGFSEQSWKLLTVVYYITQNPQGPASAVLKNIRRARSRTLVV